MTDKPHHILTLVIQKEADVPRVRSKVKLLMRAIGAPVLLVTGLAVGASETARLLLQQYGGGKVRISLFPHEIVQVECGVELLFHGNAFCLKGDTCPLNTEALLSRPPFAGLNTVFDSVQVQGGVQAGNITVICRNMQAGVSWNDVHGRLVAIRRELSADTEESYMENLRAKHDEVVRLLREKTEKNRLLDQSNNELLQLSNDLEELARERTIIEMSLRIADQVRNPATVIGGMARRLLAKGGLDEREQKKIKLIAVEADKIDELVKQFTTMAAKRRTLFAREDLVTLVEDALGACPTLQRKHIAVALQGPGQAVDIHANRQILKIAMVHVLRHLTLQAAEGAALSVAVAAGNEPQVVFFMEMKTDNNSELDHTGTETVPDNSTGLVLVEQILLEHQARLEVGKDSDHHLVITMYFPRVFHEQREVTFPAVE